MDSVQQNFACGPKKANKSRGMLSGLGGLAALGLAGSIFIFAFVFALGVNVKPLSGEFTALADAEARQGGGSVQEPGYGLSLELPEGWQVSTEAELRKETEKGFEYIEKTAGKSMPLPKVLFGATSKELAGAGVYVLVYDNEPMANGVQLLINMGEQPDGLTWIKNFSEPELAKALAYEDKQLLEMHSVSMDSLGGQKALVYAYKYKDDETKTPWESRQYQIAFPKYAVEIAIIWDESQTEAMRPVLAEILDSIKFAPAAAGNWDGV